MDDLVRDIHETLQHYQTLAEKKTHASGREYYSLSAECPAYGAMVTVSFPRPTFHQPPLDAEEKYGLSGIAGRYAMPQGLKPVELQAYAEVLGHAVRAGHISADVQQEKFEEVLTALTARNPGLAELRLDPTQEDALQDALIGIASDFNVTDMQRFHDTQGLDDLTTEIAMDFNKKFPGVALNWLPAPETFEKVTAQLEARQFKPAPAAAVSNTAPRVPQAG